MEERIDYPRRIFEEGIRKTGSLRLRKARLQFEEALLHSLQVGHSMRGERRNLYKLGGGGFKRQEDVELS